jgi:hypothetical protein
MSTPQTGLPADPCPAITALERYICDLLAAATAVANATDPAAREEATQHRARLFGGFNEHCETLHRLRDAARRECRAAGYQLGEFEPIVAASTKAAVALWGWQPPSQACGGGTGLQPIGIAGPALHGLELLKVCYERTPTPGDAPPLPPPVAPAGAPHPPADGPDPKVDGVLWWRGNRRNVPGGRVFKLIAHMWGRQSAPYEDLMDGTVWDDTVEPQTVRARASAASKALRLVGVPWRLAADLEFRVIRQEPTDATG